jgi:DNA-binding MarR family transcriptional regulator
VSGGLSRDVERFLVEHVDSIAQLEILGLLYGEPETARTAAAIARVIGVDPAWAATELGRLVGRGFVAPATNGGDPAYRFSARDPALRETIERVLQAFRERRVTVVDLVASKPSPHVRGFADAFRWRKD